MGYRVTDGGGWTFEARPDGTLRIVAGPSGVGTVYEPGDPQYELIVQRLKGVDPGIEAALGAATSGGSPEKSGALASFVSSLGLDTPEGQQAAVSLAPDVLSAVQGFVDGGGRDLPSLLKRAASLRAKIARTTNAARRARLQAELQGVQGQIDLMQASQVEAQAMLSPNVPPPSPSTIPPWVLPAAAGSLLVAGVAGLLIWSPWSK